MRLCMIRSNPHTVSPKKYYPHPPTSEPGDYFFTPSFCRSHQKYLYRVLVNTLLEALHLGVQPWFSWWITSSCFLDELQCQHREYWVVVKMIVQLLSSAASTAPYPPSGNPECHRRLWPLLGCPLSWCVGPTPSHLNSACCVVFFHSYISFNLVPYRARQLCCLQTLVRYFIFINMSSFSLISLSGLPVLLYVAVVLREVLNFLYAGINWSGSQVALCPVLSFRAVCCTSHHICFLRCLVNRRGDKGTWKGKKQSEEWSWRLGI